MGVVVIGLLLVIFGFLSLAVVIELLLHRWAGEERNQLTDRLVSKIPHSDAGRGSWTLAPEVAKLLNPSFSLTHWNEMKAWTMTRKTSFLVTSDEEHRKILSLHGCDYEGTEFSVLNGSRTTTNHPQEFDHDILCFGGSTTFCMEVSDWDTWSSRLQERLNNSVAKRYRVVNYGIAGAPGLDRIAAFRHCESLKLGDIAVFLFGANDAGWRQWYPSRAVHHLLVRPMTILERESQSRILTVAWLKREVAILLRKKIAAATASATIAAAEDAIRWANARGAKVLFVLQPNIMTSRKKTEQENQIYDSTARNLFVMLEVAYSRYLKWIKANPDIVSGTHIFDDIMPSPYMADWCHVNAIGNSVIADFIFEELMRRNLVQPEAKTSESD